LIVASDYAEAGPAGPSGGPGWIRRSINSQKQAQKPPPPPRTAKSDSPSKKASSGGGGIGIASATGGGGFGISAAQSGSLEDQSIKFGMTNDMRVVEKAETGKSN
jgi:hypothetical protein